ncbi:hypothetical protein [uncultured Oscillibacter sp.]|uniref:hypothetical protein n=1 Tax=uncultured Oscillibacter sp. TaxID=876091 RepID=UPI00260A4FD9|nr:hypothetical protein [uncultured Oscillibacter sp.]
MLRWNRDERRDNQQKVVSTSYVASVPYLGRVSIHPHIHAPGEWFLTCQALHIDKHPLGSVSPEEAERLAEAELAKRLEQHIVWCQNALQEICGKSDTPKP